MWQSQGRSHLVIGIILSAFRAKPISLVDKSICMQLTWGRSDCFTLVLSTLRRASWLGQELDVLLTDTTSDGWGYSHIVVTKIATMIILIDEKKTILLCHLIVGLLNYHIVLVEIHHAL